MWICPWVMVQFMGKAIAFSKHLSWLKRRYLNSSPVIVVDPEATDLPRDWRKSSDVLFSKWSRWPQRSAKPKGIVEVSLREKDHEKHCWGKELRIFLVACRGADSQCPEEVAVVQKEAIAMERRGLASEHRWACGLHGFQFWSRQRQLYPQAAGWTLDSVWASVALLVHCRK